jgi:hypothetical protein
MKIMTLSLLFVGALFVAAEADTGASNGEAITGNTLLDSCAKEKPECSWFILGIAETLDGLRKEGVSFPDGFQVCLPLSVTQVDVVKRVVSLMRLVASINPGLYQYAPAAPLVASELKQSYPCSKP